MSNATYLDARRANAAIDQIRIAMQRLGLTQEELAHKLGVSRLTVNQVLGSRRAISVDLAFQCGEVLGISPRSLLLKQIEHQVQVKGAMLHKGKRQ